MNSPGPSHRYAAVAPTLRALGSPARREILDLVGTERVSVHEIVERVGRSLKAVSTDLKVLSLHQLVFGVRERHKIFYRLTERGKAAIKFVRVMEGRL
jgi:DNA-binding transcriptional ArsR family regulator